MPRVRPPTGQGARCGWAAAGRALGDALRRPRRVAFCLGAAVGLDVERVNRVQDPCDIVRHVLVGSEVAQLGRVAPRSRSGAFAVYWVRKEALSKATGTGLRTPHTDVVVSGPDEPARLLSPNGADVQLRDLASRPGYVAALAIMTTRPVAIAEHDAGPLIAGRARAAPARYAQLTRGGN